ncbi:GyrI-like domain-containing protein [Agrococcus sediminis]|uniref:GyrI-like domain-containing protein n=1 Tax=Agrococcus sediminis TaxID=2599924 RepID=UPI0038047190
MIESTDPRLVTLQPTTIAAIRETVPMAGITDFFDRAYRTVVRVMASQDIHPTGAPVGVYWSAPTDTIEMSAGFPADAAVAAEEGVAAERLPAGRAVQLTHAGAYGTMRASYDRLAAWAEEQGLPLGPVMWETYLTEPRPDVDPASMRTLITWPLQEPAGS